MFPSRRSSPKKWLFFNASHRQEPRILPLDATLRIPSCSLGFDDVVWIIIQLQLELFLGRNWHLVKHFLLLRQFINPRHGASTRFEQWKTIPSPWPNIGFPCKHPFVEPIHELSLFSPHSQWKGSGTLHWWVSLMFYSWLLTPFPFQPTLALKLVGSHFVIGS